MALSGEQPWAAALKMAKKWLAKAERRNGWNEGNDEEGGK
jgi:hypothetical protein